MRPTPRRFSTALEATRHRVRRQRPAPTRRPDLRAVVPTAVGPTRLERARPRAPPTPRLLSRAPQASPTPLRRARAPPGSPAEATDSLPTDSGRGPAGSGRPNTSCGHQGRPGHGPDSQAPPGRRAGGPQPTSGHPDETVERLRRENVAIRVDRPAPRA